MKVRDYKKINESNYLKDETKKAYIERKNKENINKKFLTEYNNLVKEYGKNIRKNNINDNVNKKALEILSTLIDKYKIDYENYVYEPKTNILDIHKEDNALGHTELQNLFIKNKSKVNVKTETETKKDVIEKNDIKKDDNKKIIISDEYKPIATKLINSAKAPLLSTALAGYVTKTVKMVQDIVNTDIDGKFGRKTKQAVVDFQKAHNLKPDGVVGKDTWKIILGKDVSLYNIKIQQKDIKPTFNTTKISKTINDINVIKKLFDSYKISNNIRILYELKLSDYFNDEDYEHITIKPDHTNDTISVFYDNELVKDPVKFKKVGDDFEFDDPSDKDIIAAELYAIKKGIVNNTDKSDILFVNKQKNEKVTIDELYEKVKKKEKGYEIGKIYFWMTQNRDNKGIIKKLRDMFTDITGKDIESYLIDDESIIKTSNQRRELTELLMDSISEPEMVANLIYQASNATFGTHNEMLREIEKRLSKVNKEFIKEIAKIFQSKYNESIIDNIKGEENSEGEFYNLIQLFKEI